MLKKCKNRRRKSKRIVTLLTAFIFLISYVSLIPRETNAQTVNDKDGSPESLNPNAPILPDSPAKEVKSPDPNQLKEKKKPVELTNLRTENEKVFDNQDGTYTRKFYTEPVHAKKKDKWESISTSVTDADSQTLTPENTNIKVQMEKQMEKGEYINFNQKGNSLSYKLIKAEGPKGSIPVKDVNPVTNKQSINYNGIFPDINLRLNISNDFVKEDLILEKYTGHNIFHYQLKTDLQATKQDDGSIVFTDSNKKVIYTLPKPYMIDSNVDPQSGEAERSEKVSYDLKMNTDGYELILNADDSWLQDSKRKYPVYIDPTTEVQGVTNAYVSSAYPTNNYSGSKLWDSGQSSYLLKVGYYDGATGTNYAYLKQDLSSFEGATVESATFNVFDKWHYYADNPNGLWLDTVNAAWDPSTITWNNKPSSTNVTSTTVTRGKWASFNVTNTVQSWINKTKPNYGFKLHTNGNGQTYWKKVVSSENATEKPNLSLTYSYPKPSAPTAKGYSYQTSTGEGYFDLSWDAKPGATGYKVAIFNGYNYEYIPVGNTTSWSTKGAKLWPTNQEVLEGKYKLHLDGTGAELPLDPGPVYKNAYQAGSSFGDYSNVKKYWFRVIAEYPKGNSPTSDEAMVSVPLKTPEMPSGKAYGIDSLTGYVDLQWNTVPNATGYKVHVYNGVQYESFDVGNVTNWSTKGKKIWPTISEISNGSYSLHKDGTGSELAMDPSPVYKNAGGRYYNNKNYWFRIEAYNSSGLVSYLSNPFMPILQDASNQSQAEIELTTNLQVGLSSDISSDPELLAAYKENGWIASGDTLTKQVNQQDVSVQLDGNEYLTNEDGSINVSVDNSNKTTSIDIDGQSQQITLEDSKTNIAQDYLSVDEYISNMDTLTEADITTSDEEIELDESNTASLDQNLGVYSLNNGQKPKSGSTIHCNRINGYLGDGKYWNKWKYPKKASKNFFASDCDWALGRSRVCWGDYSSKESKRYCSNAYSYKQGRCSGLIGHSKKYHMHSGYRK
ncbi:DNRLRE domain-containing protein [Priestia megaterium]|uniref:DNRLRE domain-containing protein n=1 Tax=Priestia megaterium TaxID=1404 RepID=UPI000BFC91D1|nr:DNRLRE domain-containing protein [Priestia megaterium]MBW0934202.1 DNRLRE domain-containing protein [Priestia megaterium]PGX80598.1 hypothetical protein COE31_04580 [Priestia megaterium]